MVRLTARNPLWPVAIAALTLLAAAPAEDVLTADSLATLRGVGEAAISPDGGHVAYTLYVPRKPGDDKDGSAWSELHVLRTADDSSRPFVSGEVSVRSLHWTPDGKGIAFLSKREGDEHTSLYVIPGDGGEARRAVSFENSILAYDLSPDGQHVAFVATEVEDKQVKKRRDQGFKARIYEEDWRPRRVWLTQLFAEDEEPKPLDLDGSAFQLAFGVDGLLAVSLAPTPLVDDQYMSQKVHLVDTTSGKVLGKVNHVGKLGRFALSPDGRRLALLAAADLNDPTEGRLKVALAPTAGDTDPTDLLPGLEGDVDAFQWQNNDEILALGSAGVATTFFEISADGSTCKDLMPPGDPALTSISLSTDGNHAAFVGSTPTHPTEVFLMSHGETAPRRVTNSNPWLDDLRMAPQEVITFAARDGLELEGLLIRPLDAVEGQRYPLILVVHGGPESHYNNAWVTRYSTPGQVAAAEGFAVFYPNYRGSTGRGVEFAKLSQGDPAGKEFDDLVDAVDHLVAIGLVDVDKVGVTGGSYGGYATGWCATRYSDRFAAGVMFVGISNKVSKVGTTDIPNEEYHVHARKRPWDDWNYFLERSPVYHAGNGKTPLLIMHGEDDPRVNVGQSRELYRHLKLRGQAPVRLVLYPGEQHGNRKAAARLDYCQRMLRWMRHYLQGPGGEPPALEWQPADAEDADGASPE